MDGNPISEVGSLTDSPTTTLREVPPALQPPVQKNQNGRPDVTFDPCLEFGDETVRQAGMDPATRKRDDFIAEYTFLGCDFSGSEYGAGVSISNVTFEESVERYRETTRDRISIGSREALLTSNRLDPVNCAVVIRLRIGILMVDVDPRTDARRAGKDGCTLAPGVASVFEAALPKDR